MAAACYANDNVDQQAFSPCVSERQLGVRPAEIESRRVSPPATTYWDASRKLAVARVPPFMPQQAGQPRDLARRMMAQAGGRPRPLV